MFNRLTTTVYEASPVWAQNALCTLAGYRYRRLRYGREFDRWTEFYQRSAKWSEGELLEYQKEQLQSLIKSCFDHVPFYAERWRAAGLTPADLVQVEDLSRFPITSKEDLFQAGTKVIGANVPRRDLQTVYTGGSTGLPLPRYFTSDEFQRHYAMFWDRLRPGVRWGDYYATFQGKEVVPGDQKTPPFWRENRVAGQRLYSMRHLSPEKLQHYASSLVETPFVYYQGYASIMSVVAAYMDEHGAVPHAPPKAVFSTSEELPESMKAVMERTWRTRVWDEYCQAERCAMIMECPHGNRHVQLDYGVIEFQKVGRENGYVLGELLCTGFVPQAAPLVRYAIGDRALIDEAGTCPCGRPGPVIKAIRGRTGDTIATPDGREYPHISLIVDMLRNVRRTQVVQYRPEEILVRVVPFSEFSQKDEDHVVRCFEETIGGGIRARVERVREIERLPNGKIKSIINRLDV